MARQRERFERTDVPKGGPYTNLIGVIVCLVSLAAAAGIGWAVWNYVTLESRLEDSALSDGIAAQGSTYVPDGYGAAADEVTCYLLLTADSLEDAGGTLSSVRVLAVNATQGTAALVSIPADVGLTVDGEALTPAGIFSAQGAEACVAPLSSASNAWFSHAILATEDVLEGVAQLAGSDASGIMGSASGLLSKMRTDMDADELVALANALSSVGTANIVVSDAALYAETTLDEAGNAIETGRQLVDATQLCLALGTIVVPA